jgi:hypothetical protein
MSNQLKTVAELRAARETDLSGLLLALWWDARGDWHRAHEVAQEIENPEGAWVHAYLHRKEGNPSNAAYWYRQAGRPAASCSLDAEWEEIAKSLLGNE